MENALQVLGNSISHKEEKISELKLYSNYLANGTDGEIKSLKKIWVEFKNKQGCN